jgi:glycosyltransferase involved in cell wall biosynthesis
MGGSIVIPAHNEASVIERTLAPLAALAATGEVDVVVAANGCTDDTVARARRVPGVRVLDLPEPSKVAALNAADAATDRFPRIYLDADIVAPPESVRAVLEVLATGPALAARPPFVYDLTDARASVRAYYRARLRLPANSAALWGAGCYAMSREGRGRFGDFPELVADDYFVDTLFEPHEKRVVDAPPVVVRVPRTPRALGRVLRRTYGGNVELHRHVRAHAGPSPVGSGNARALLGSVRSPVSLGDATVYATFSLVGRSRVPGHVGAWQRDDSSRS